METSTTQSFFFNFANAILHHGFFIYVLPFQAIQRPGFLLVKAKPPT